MEEHLESSCSSGESRAMVLASSQRAINNLCDARSLLVKLDFFSLQ